MSLHHWRKFQMGYVWKPITTQSEIQMSACEYKDIAELSYFGFHIHGTFNHDDKTDGKPKERGQNFVFVPTQDEIESIYKRELVAHDSPHVMQQRSYQYLIKQRRIPKQNDHGIQHHQSFRQVFGF